MHKRDPALSIWIPCCGPTLAPMHKALHERQAACTMTRHAEQTFEWLRDDQGTLQLQHG